MLKKLIEAIKKLAPKKGANSKPVFEVDLKAMRASELRFIIGSRVSSTEDRIKASTLLKTKYATK